MTDVAVLEKGYIGGNKHFGIDSELTDWIPGWQ